MDVKSELSARLQYPGTAVSTRDRFFPIEAGEKSRANDLEKKSKGTDAKNCYVNKAKGENTFVSINLDKSKPEFFIVMDGFGITPLAQGKAGTLFSSISIRKNAKNDWVKCGPGVMKVRKDSEPTGRVSGTFNKQDNSNQEKRVSYKSLSEIPGEKLDSYLSGSAWNDQEKFKFATCLLESCEAMNKAGRDINTVIRSEVIMYDANAKEVCFLNDAVPDSARAAGTDGKEAYRSSGLAGSEKNDVLACGIVLANLFSEDPLACKAARVNAESGKVVWDDKLIMKEVYSHNAPVAKACIDLFKRMASDKAERRPSLSDCKTTLSMQIQIYEKILQNQQINESRSRNKIDDLAFLRMQRDKLSKSKGVDQDKMPEQLHLLEKQITGSIDRLEQSKKNHKSTRGKKDSICQTKSRREDARQTNEKSVNSSGGLKESKLKNKEKGFDKASSNSGDDNKELFKPIRQGSDTLKLLATNDKNKKYDLVNKISDTDLCWPLEYRVRYLDDLCCYIILNEHKGYAHWAYSQSSRSVDFTQTQINHISALQEQALETVKQLLKKGDKCSKRTACKFLDTSLVLHFQPSHTLEQSNVQCQGKWQELMAKTTGIWRFRNHGEKCEFTLATQNFKDGREGDPMKDKALTTYMQRRACEGEESAGKTLLGDMADKKLVDQLTLLENIFCYVAFHPTAYTRGVNDILTDTAEYICSWVSAPKVPREDVSAPTETKMFHIKILQAAYRQVLKKMESRTDPLTVEEVKVISESMLAEFIPVQYQSEVLKRRVSPLGLQAQSLLEEKGKTEEGKGNFDALKHYYKQQFELNFS